MKRKIIESGNQCMLMSLPIKWMRENNLGKGDEVDVQIDSTQLVVRGGNYKKPLKEINIDLKNDSRTSIRSHLVNLYRGGFEKININYSGEKELLYDILESDMIDFDLFEKGNNVYVLEQVSLPLTNNYEKIVEKNFFILNQIINTFNEVDVKKDVHRLQKYDNFIKRCITKGLVESEAKTFLWQFFSDLVHIGKEIMHFQYELKLNYSFNEYDLSLIKQMEEIFSLIKNAYFKQDVNLLFKVHKIEKKIREDMDEVFKKSSDVKISYYVLQIIRTMHLSTSPLIGALELRES